MINREDFKLMAVGKFCIGKTAIKNEDYMIFLEGALFAYDKLLKEEKPSVSLTEKLANKLVINDCYHTGQVKLNTGGITHGTTV